MPLHRFYIPPGLYTPEDKAKLAEAVTAIYTEKLNPPLPPFLVVVLFIEVKDEDYFVGGKSTQRFVRVLVHHLAKQMESDPIKVWFMDLYEETIKAFTKDRGVDWEVAVTNEDPMLWRENGLIPPYAVRDLEAAKVWVKENKPVPYEVKLSAEK